MSEVKVNKISPRSGTTVTLGDSGDTIAITSGASLTGFTSTGIDDNATSTAVTILSSGFVGVGQTNPTTNFHVGDDSAGNENTSIRIEGGSTSGYSQVHFADSGDVNVGRVQYTHSSNTMALYTNDTEAMRIDSSQNVLVGMTSASVNNTGFYALGAGGASTTRAGGTPLNVNRQTDDGTVISVRKDGTEVGSIGVVGGDIPYFATSDGNDCGINLDGDSQRINPANGSGGAIDNQIDLGQGGARFKDLYLSGNIYLGGTGSANALDDYEEGSFTPTYSTESGGESITYDGLTSGKYIKVGQMVYITGFIRTDAFSGGGSYVYLGGFPFTSASGNPFKSFIGVARSTTWGGDFPSACEVVDGDTKAFIKYRTSANGGSDNIVQSDMATGGNSNVLIFSGTYKSSS